MCFVAAENMGTVAVTDITLHWNQKYTQIICWLTGTMFAISSALSHEKNAKTKYIV